MGIEEHDVAWTFRPQGPVDLVVLVVTYNNADGIGGMLDSVRAAVDGLSVRVVVADNDSKDGTAAVVASVPDVLLVNTGGNLGYAGGVNAAATLAGDAAALLVLNPDLRVRPGALRALVEAARQDVRIGIVAPRIEDEHGHLATSIFNEPTAWRAWCDALLGRIWSTRGPAFSEWNREPEAYRVDRDVDCASGAALLVTAEAAAAIGEWDEGFFLYSEETDYCRRARDLGFRVVFRPGATVEHEQGGSGSSPELDALLAVNRVRYMRKHSPRTAGLYRWGVWVGELLRSWGSASHRLAAAYLRDERRWPRLPQASRPVPGGTPGEVPGEALRHATAAARRVAS